MTPANNLPSLEDFYRALGTALRLERDRRGLSQGEMAEICGVERRTLSDLENGDNDKLKHFLRYAWSLGLDFSRLVLKAEALTFEDSARAELARRFDEHSGDDEQVG
jgi:transcriptional regulator with XRE-family HTH domain